GTGAVIGSVTNAAQVNPGGVGRPGVLAITGPYSQFASGALNIDLGGTAAGNGYDRLAVGGTASLGGTLNVATINGFVPGGADSFQILTFGARTGDFAAKNGLNPPSGPTLVPTFHPNDLT